MGAGMPPEFDPNKKYPLILNIHGGPHAAYGYVFESRISVDGGEGLRRALSESARSTTYGRSLKSVRINIPAMTTKI